MRIRPHPNTCALSRAEFPWGHFGAVGNIYLTYLPLQFGRMDSPACFASVGRGIAMAQRNFSHTRKLRDGNRDLASLLFVEGAIFTGKGVGRRPEVCASSWRDACRGVLGGDSTDRDKSEEEAEWKSAQIPH